ncbi:MAG: hypothetical protein GMKNLPBB_02407 [Myxococcota bacterium]|nr:hypothetical protein [Myxococcota bacterium]
MVSRRLTGISLSAALILYSPPALATETSHAQPADAAAPGERPASQCAVKTMDRNGGAARVGLGVLTLRPGAVKGGSVEITLCLEPARDNGFSVQDRYTVSLRAAGEVQVLQPPMFELSPAHRLREFRTDNFMKNHRLDQACHDGGEALFLEGRFRFAFQDRKFTHQGDLCDGVYWLREDSGAYTQITGSPSSPRRRKPRK